MAREEQERVKVQERREEEVEEILRKRPDESVVVQGGIDEAGRTSMEVSEMLNQRFGKVQR
jgi:hypothetical protein